MIILHLLFISNVAKQYRADTIPGFPFFATTKISNMKKNLSKEGLTHTHKAGDSIFEVNIENSDIFNNNSSIVKTSLFLNFMTDSKFPSIVLHDFNDKIKFPETYYSFTQNKSFLTRIFVENNIPRQIMNRCYGNIPLIQYKFLCFLLMQNDKDRPNKFNAFVRLTAFFSMILEVYINLYQKKSVLQKLFLFNDELKANERKKQKNILIFGIFFINSYQIYNEDNLTLTIKNSNEFYEISQYKNITKFIIISENIYSIPSNSFSEWPSVVSVDFGNSVSNIGSSVFSSCSNLETIIIGENVTEIGGGAFSLCSSIKNITIPNSVTTIGNSAFSLCSNLTLLILGYGIKNIGGSAFGNCYNLQCIYYYGDKEPEIGEGAFYNVFTSVITYPTYVGSKFGNLDVAKENTEGTCEPLPTHSFRQSNTFGVSNTYSIPNTYFESCTYSQLSTFSRSYTFSKSNTFTESLLQNDLTQSFSYLLTITLSITHSFTYCETQTKTILLISSDSMYIHIETEYIYYDYTVIVYSTYYNYYSNFFTFVNRNEIHSNDNKTIIIIIIVCVIVIIVIISLLIILLIRIKNKKEEIDENETSEQKNDNQTNTFTTGISISNIEEDPFADDFKEDKFIEQM